MQTANQVNLTDATDEDSDHDFCNSCSEWLPVADTDEDGLCPTCHAEALAEAAAEAKEEAIEDAQGEVDEAQDELESLLDQMKELQAEIAEKRAEVKAAKKRLAKLEA